MTRRPAPPPYSTVVFDCDSTLSAIEGIEALAQGHQEVRELTTRAMEGEVPLEEVFGERLRIVRPSLGQLDTVGRSYVEQALPNAAPLVAALQALGKRVVIVSGGLRPAVSYLAAELGIDSEDVFAVDVHSDAHGAYLGFDESSPLARSGGKLEVLNSIRDAGPVALVGDGATDLEAAPACARFIAFGGVERRPAVFEAADETCDKPDLAALLPLLLDELELGQLASLPTHRPLVEAALSHYP